MLIFGKNGLFCLYNLYYGTLILTIRTFTKKCVTLRKNNIFQFCKKWCILERQGYHIKPTWFLAQQKCRTPPLALKPYIPSKSLKWQAIWIEITKNITSSMLDQINWCSKSFFKLRWWKNGPRKKITLTVKKNTNLEKTEINEKNKNIHLFQYNFGRALCFYFLNFGQNFENLCFFYRWLFFFLFRE